MTTRAVADEPASITARSGTAAPAPNERAEEVAACRGRATVAVGDAELLGYVDRQDVAWTSSTATSWAR